MGRNTPKKPLFLPGMGQGMGQNQVSGRVKPPSLATNGLTKRFYNGCGGQI